MIPGPFVFREEGAMIRVFFSLAAVAALLLLPATAEAQRRGGGGGGGGRVGVGGGRVGAPGGHVGVAGGRAGFGVGRGFGRGGFGGFGGYGLYGLGGGYPYYGLGGGYPYYGLGGGYPNYGLGGGYYSSNPTYITQAYYPSSGPSYVAPAYIAPSAPGAPDSGMQQPPALPKNMAQIQVLLPDPEATLLFDGNKTTTLGRARVFDPPELEPGVQYHYKVTASWMQGGKVITDVRNVPVMGGQVSFVDFTRPASGEKVAPPANKKDE
jgi:uncharacterized protein (TIGR03000 family)